MESGHTLTFLHISQNLIPQTEPLVQLHSHHDQATVMASLPSLEQQCFLYILLHLEKFPVEYLSLLPVGIRQRLLLSAPVADVYQLEQTTFVKGINMDEVWKTMCEQRLPLIPSLPDLRAVFGHETPPRELMTTAITFQILHTDRVLHRFFLGLHCQPCSSKVTAIKHNVLFYIFLQDDDSISSAEESMEPLEPYPQLAKRNTEGGKEQEAPRVLDPPHVSDPLHALVSPRVSVPPHAYVPPRVSVPPHAYVPPRVSDPLHALVSPRVSVPPHAYVPPRVSVPLHALVPPRYASYDTAMSDDNTKIVEEFMAVTCQALPSMAFFDCNTLKGNIQGELVKKAEHVCLSCEISQRFRSMECEQVISSVLSPLLRHNSLLQHITLENCSDEKLHYIISEVNQLLISDSAHTVNKLSISVSHNISRRRSYGCGNHRRDVYMGIERKSHAACRNLGLMIPRFSSLHTLKLEKWWRNYSYHCHQDHVNLLDVLCSFLKQPHFQCLALVDTCFPLVYIQRLVRAFLLSPCSQPQTLQLEKILLTSRLRIIRRSRGPFGKEVKLPLTEWDNRDCQGSHSIISKAAREFKTLTIDFAFHSGGERHHLKEDLATLEAARSWLSDLAHFKCELKSLVVQGDPSQKMFML